MNGVPTCRRSSSWSSADTPGAMAATAASLASATWLSIFWWSDSSTCEVSTAVKIPPVNDRPTMLSTKWVEVARSSSASSRCFSAVRDSTVGGGSEAEGFGVGDVPPRGVPAAGEVVVGDRGDVGSATSTSWPWPSARACSALALAIADWVRLALGDSGCSGCGRRSCKRECGVLTTQEILL